MAGAESRPQEGSEKSSPSRTANADSVKPGSVRHDNDLKLAVVWCPPGTFTMADSIGKQDRPSETVKLSPVQVTLSRGFWIGKYPVTRAEWRHLMKTRPWSGRFAESGDRLAATYITWNDAVDFCRKLTQRERGAGRLASTWEYTLPTEAQWEWACRAGTATRYCFGDDASRLGDYAWFYDSAYGVGDNRLHPVGKKKAYGWGIHDMHGNVHEWCRDQWVEKLPGGRDPEVKAEPSPNTLRVCRGASLVSSAAACESGYHGCHSPGYHKGDFGGRAGGDLGFRVALCSRQEKGGSN
jgi:formylglycine-generating enzyme required for sulfatase activity